MLEIAAASQAGQAEEEIVKLNQELENVRQAGDEAFATPLLLRQVAIGRTIVPYGVMLGFVRSYW